MCQADLTDANLRGASLTDAEFTDAGVALTIPTR
ncbi:pentapeptide repeat-containing protein [Rhodococcus sp. NPDC047139]